jgi:hypothetical protein
MMNSVTRQSSNVLPGDDLDGILRDFYRSEMPHPWPEMEVPLATVKFAVRPATLPMGRRYSLGGSSRLALAASIGLLALGIIFLGGKSSKIEPMGPDLNRSIGSRVEDDPTSSGKARITKESLTQDKYGVPTAIFEVKER